MKREVKITFTEKRTDWYVILVYVSIIWLIIDAMYRVVRGYWVDVIQDLIWIYIAGHVIRVYNDELKKAKDTEEEGGQHE